MVRVGPDFADRLAETLSTARLQQTKTVMGLVVAQGAVETPRLRLLETLKHGENVVQGDPAYIADGIAPVQLPKNLHHSTKPAPESSPPTMTTPAERWLGHAADTTTIAGRSS